MASGPTTSAARITSLPSSWLKRSATGSMRRASKDFFHFSSVREAGSLPFSVCFFTHLSKLASGLPKWEQAITEAPLSSRYWIVGRAARMRLSSVIAPVTLS